MEHSKYLYKFMCIILTMAFCNKIEAKCRLCKHLYDTVTTFKYIKTDTIMSTPEIKIDVVKYSPKDASKIFYVLKRFQNPKKTNGVKTQTNELFSIVKALQENAHTTPTTTARPMSTTTPNPPKNIQVTNHAINGDSYVYNVQNHGTHFHYYGSSNTNKSNPHKIDIVPLKEKNPN